MKPTSAQKYRHGAVRGFVRQFALLSLVTLLAACEESRSLLEPDLPSLSTPETPVSRIQLQAGRNQEVGSAYHYKPKVWDASGKLISNPKIQWSSENPAVATVDAKGYAVAVSPGISRITATSGGVTATSNFKVRGKGSPPPEVARILLTPQTARLEAGDTLRVSAVAVDATGEPMEDVAIVWASDNLKASSVDAEGLVKALAPGEASISATAGSVTARASISVTAPPVNEWNRVLTNTTLKGDVVVPSGEKWLIGANVRIEGNLRTDGGTIAMRPGSSLHFIGADPNRYVGGGMRYDSRFENDYGIWVGGTGVLDIRGTPKAGWNRTGSDPSWRATDELWISPTAPGDFTPRRWYPGQPIPRIDPRMPAAEVMNVTRDIIIQGPGHIHISSSVPQRIEYVQLRQMGIVNPQLGDVTGRYALHLHMMGDGSRGTLVRGVAAIDSRGKVLVPHTSHGVTLTDNVVVNSFGEGFWWDKGDPTDDILVDRLKVSGVHAPRSATGQASRFAAIVLGVGKNMEIRNSAASGVRGSAKYGAGFEWLPANRSEHAHWEFSEGNVAHNNTLGIRFWNNSGQPHMVRNTLLYNNDGAILNGAYNNSNRYVDVLSIGGRGIDHNSSSNLHEDGGPGRYERVQIYATEGPALTIGHQNLPGKTRQEFIDCVLQSAPGHPKVLIKNNAVSPFIAVFRGCGLTPEDVVFDGAISTARLGSDIIIEHESGKKWQILVDSSTLNSVVSEIR